MLIIRKADEKDFTTIIDIMESSARKKELEGFIPPEEVTKGFYEELKEELKRKEHGVVIAERNDKQVGFAFYRTQRGCIEIEEIDVAKAFQRQGIGKALVQHIEKIGRAKKIKTLLTGTSINREGKPWRAYGFWTHLGFVDTGERVDSLYGLRYARLVKSLQPPR